MKHFFAFAVLATVLALVASDHASWGGRQAYDRLLDSRHYTKGSKLLQVVTMDVHYNGAYNITMINVVDRAKCGIPSLRSGGPGSRQATIHLKSLRGKSLDFQVEIYGR
ncbi:probable salivary secreted peptide [Condylostylus longicornis]|uniref:probable salivary secreted peptide n=1 Tax=Condylostylus longicornis TaxID=2530218 RepID=UPI00244DD5D9|nr:probable salivary secreted peptide [Condylostylus longicornis]